MDGFKEGKNSCGLAARLQKVRILVKTVDFSLRWREFAEHEDAIWEVGVVGCVNI